MPLLADEIAIDGFAGGGGTSTGFEMAIGRPPDIAINHNAEALGMHAANHPKTRHLCDSVWKVDIVKEVDGRPVGLLWLSPDCTYFSKAKGGRPIRYKGKKIRGLAWVGLRWAGLIKPRVIMLENVEEFQFWGPVHAEPIPGRRPRKCVNCKRPLDAKPCPKRRGMTFRRWRTQLKNLGYKVEHRERRAMIDGAPTSRKRLFVIARRDGEPIVWPEPTHGPGLIPYRTAAECIDWTIPCPSIFLTKEEGRAAGCNRPLADNTLNRIAKGIRKYILDSAKPFIVRINHGESGGKRDFDLGRPFPTVAGKVGEALVTPFLQHIQHSKAPDGTMAADEPLRTVTAKPDGGGIAVVVPFLGTYYGANRVGGDRTADVQEPLRTQPTENRHALVTAFMERQFGMSTGSDADAPVGTITAGGGGKTAVIAAHLAQHNTGNVGRKADAPLSTITHRGTQQAIVATSIMKMRGTNTGHATDAPLQTISANGTHFAQVQAFLIKYFGTEQNPQLDEPLHTITSKHRFGLVTVEGEEYEIVDIGMRMLTPRELFLCQGFPPDYIIDHGRRICPEGHTMDLFDVQIPLTKTAQVRMCGNSVSPYSACALIKANLGEEKVQERAA